MDDHVTFDTADADAPVEPRDLLELERQVCFALAVASRSVIAVYRPLLEPLRLTHPQYLVMLALWQYAPVSVTELSHRLQLEPATLSPLLKRLEAVGYLRRERVVGNERALRLSLTAEGTALRERALAIPEAVMARLQITLAEAEHLNAFLTDVITRAKRAQA
ncbi:MAG: MarR family winged helix-turn-helix transcriptional regulator [Friedmanniella sp.]